MKEFRIATTPRAWSDEPCSHVLTDAVDALLCWDPQVGNTGALRLYEGLGFLRDKRLHRWAKEPGAIVVQIAMRCNVLCHAGPSLRGQSTQSSTHVINSCDQLMRATYRLDIIVN